MTNYFLISVYNRENLKLCKKYALLVLLIV